jgi:hypothetical protein
MLQQNVGPLITTGEIKNYGTNKGKFPDCPNMKYSRFRKRHKAWPEFIFAIPELIFTRMEKLPGEDASWYYVIKINGITD